MTFDHYVFLSNNNTPREQVNEAGLVYAPEDECVVAFLKAEFERDQAKGKEKNAHKKSDKKEEGLKKKEAVKRKNKARQNYMDLAAKREYSLPSDFLLELDHTSLLDPAWFAIDVSFTLESPWYSKDDRPLHVLDNPVRKDRVFGVPFMSAASWKGLLRWACRMQAGLSEHLEKHDMRMEGWQDPSWILHLFGNERGEDERFRSGALVCHPTWFDNKVAFEVINPHDRARRAGTQPIYYEVVPAGTEGKLQLLYAPLPGEIERDQTTPDTFIPNLIDSIRALLERYGISAKRTAGWGKAEIDLKKSKLLFLEGSPLDHFIPDATVPYEAPSNAGDTPSLRRKELSLEKFINAMAKSGNTRQGGNA